MQCANMQYINANMQYASMQYVNVNMQYASCSMQYVNIQHAEMTKHAFTNMSISRMPACKMSMYSPNNM